MNAGRSWCLWSEGMRCEGLGRGRGGVGEMIFDGNFYGEQHGGLASLGDLRHQGYLRFSDGRQHCAGRA